MITSVVLDLVFTTKPRDWPGRTSLEITYFVSVGCKINYQSYAGGQKG